MSLHAHEQKEAASLILNDFPHTKLSSLTRHHVTLLSVFNLKVCE
jgi:hypothetical protein